MIPVSKYVNMELMINKGKSDEQLWYNMTSDDQLIVCVMYLKDVIEGKVKDEAEV